MSRLPEILRKHQSDLLRDWMQEQLKATTRRADLIKEPELHQQATEFLNLLQKASHDGDFSNIQSQAYAPVRELLSDISQARARQGFTPAETATFVFSFKQPLFSRLHKELASDAQQLAEETWAATVLLDKLGLFTVEAYLKSREEVIQRQQQEMLELSTPVVKLWEGVLALPLIGTLDSARTSVVMESLLQRIVETGSQLAIIDITGVPTVDTLVAQHLIKTITAARLMGAECIISGIRPQIAQTIVHLGVALADVTTKANLSDAFGLALQKMGLSVRPIGKAANKAEA
jgi:rsbT co-antagonist protein RsbR